MILRAFIQARMSSRRFPGKVLAPFRGQPIIRCVVDAVRAALPDVPVTVATSLTPSDEPLRAYLRAIGVPVFAGSLEDVLGRFARCLEANPCEHVLRVCADSPLLDRAVLRAAAAAAAERGGEPLDLLSTTLERTLPKGQNVEVIRGATLQAIDGSGEADEADREHVTRFLHRHRDRFRVASLASSDPSLASLDHAIDTVQDLHRLESLPEAELAAVRAVRLRVVTP